jgi:hypothetical protein
VNIHGQEEGSSEEGSTEEGSTEEKEVNCFGCRTVISRAMGGFCKEILVALLLWVSYASQESRDALMGAKAQGGWISGDQSMAMRRVRL